MITKESVSRVVVGDDMVVHVSTSHLLEHKHERLPATPGETFVTFRIKPDRRRVHTMMPAGLERRRA